MHTRWEREEIENILEQLERGYYPFPGYRFVREDEKIKVLGGGASAWVYEAESTKSQKRTFAIKVLGFSDLFADSEMFRREISNQKTTAEYAKYIVKIYDYVELLVWIDTDNRVVDVQKRDDIGDNNTDLSGGDLRNVPNANMTNADNGNIRMMRLQFILMERLTPIYKKLRFDDCEVFPHELTGYNEKEVLKLARDICTALAGAHSNNILHRDIKPLNIFYDYEKGHYKLGDFGIARATSDGTASTIMYTPGYGAPEVVSRRVKRYDKTADIYSFGMTLYFLLNNMKMPEKSKIKSDMSDEEKMTVDVKPCNCSDEFWRVIRRMISYDPSDRYQSVDEILTEIDGMLINGTVGYQKKHKYIYVLFGVAAAIWGTILMGISFADSFELSLSVFTCIVLALATIKGVKILGGKKTAMMSFLILIAGIVGYMCDGLSAAELGWVICLFVLSGKMTLMDVLGFGLLNISYFITIRSSLYTSNMADLQWMALLAVSLAFVFLYYAFVISDKDEERFLAKTYMKKNKYWKWTIFIYFLVWFTGDLAKGVIWADLGENYEMRYLYWFTSKPMDWIFGEGTFDSLGSIQFDRVGFWGFAICLVWFIREKILAKREAIQNKED